MQFRLAMIGAMLWAAVFCVLPAWAGAAESKVWRESLRHRDAAYFESAPVQQALDNVLSHQAASGGWPKNLDTAAKLYQGDPAALKGTFDNGATVKEVRLLARAWQATQQPRYRQAVERALDHILEAQYPTGGWPQSHPPDRSYHRHITFNDNAMVNVMELVREAANSKDFEFLDEARRIRAAQAFDRGITCVLKAQIRVRGELTVWCAQHDEITLEPRPGRKFELVSLSGSESAGILRMLMAIPEPTPEVISSVNAGCSWFERSKITGMRIKRIEDRPHLVPDPQAPPLWARFYDIETNQPIFSDRDSIKRLSLDEIELERATGYAWYGPWGEPVLKRWKTWQQEHHLTEQPSLAPPAAADKAQGPEAHPASQP